jgi:hypothetical protein
VTEDLRLLITTLTMSKTFYPPDALYVCCTFMEDESKASYESSRYFALERGRDYADNSESDVPIWIFCEWNKENFHLNYEKLPDDDINTFIDAVVKALQVQPKSNTGVGPVTDE